jgi:hypothetical protein
VVPLLVLPRPILACNSRQPLCFHILAASLSSPKKSTPLESSKSRLFFQSTRGGVYPPFLSALQSGLPGFGFQAKEPVTPFPPTFSRNIAPKRIESATNCARAPTVPLSAFKINTCKSVSKQRTLSPFRMNTCKKRGEGAIHVGNHAILADAREGRAPRACGDRRRSGAGAGGAALGRA